MSGPVVVAAAEHEIAKRSKRRRPRGADRRPICRRAPTGFTPRWSTSIRECTHDVVVNLQGDLPALDPAYVRAVVEALAATGADIATLAAEIDDEADRDNPNVVKPVVAWDVGGERGRALYFTRARAPHGDGPLFHHVGIYAYTREALARFVALRRRRWRSARSSSSCARSKRACTSRWRAWTPCRSASIRRPISRKRAILLSRETR